MTPDTLANLHAEIVRYLDQEFGLALRPAHSRAIKALICDALLSTSPLEPCIGSDPLCPCQDGDSCHHVDTKDTKAWPIPENPS